MFVNNIHDVDDMYLQLAQFNLFRCCFNEVQFESQGHSLTESFCMLLCESFCMASEKIKSREAVALRFFFFELKWW